MTNYYLFICFFAITIKPCAQTQHIQSLYQKPTVNQILEIILEFETATGIKESTTQTASGIPASYASVYQAIASRIVEVIKDNKDDVEIKKRITANQREDALKIISQVRKIWKYIDDNKTITTEDVIAKFPSSTQDGYHEKITGFLETDIEKMKSFKIFKESLKTITSADDIVKFHDDSIKNTLSFTIGTIRAYYHDGKLDRWGEDLGGWFRKALQYKVYEEESKLISLDDKIKEIAELSNPGENVQGSYIKDFDIKSKIESVLKAANDKLTISECEELVKACFRKHSSETYANAGWRKFKDKGYMILVTP